MQRYWAGMNYILNNCIGFMAGVDIMGKFRLGYTYEKKSDAASYYYLDNQELVLALMLD